jgi:hypothetical protein
MESTEITISTKYHFMPLDQASKPKGHIVYNIQNSWWVVHPEKGLAFFGKGYSSPQCNTNESISRHLCPLWGEVKFIEQVFAPCNVSDYCD